MAAKSSRRSPEAELRKTAVRERRRDLALYAGAGSGKTRLLVDRYLSLVRDDGVPPGEILAITFTVRAAAEMRRRVVAGLRAAGLEARRRQAERAEITTIHGFSAALLREHFYLAGADPDFRVPGDVDVDCFLDAAFTGWFRKRDAGFFELAARHGEDFLRRAVLDLVRQEQSLGYGAERLAALAKDIAPERGARRTELDRRRGELLGQAAEALRSLVAEKLGGKSAEKLSAAARLLPRIEAGAGDDATLAALAESTSRLLKLTDEGKKRLAELRGALENLEGLSEAAWQAELDSERHRRTLYGVAAGTLDEFERYKARRGLVDYEDMQRAARDLLRDQPGVAAALSRRYRHILVDEFQDTNRLQKELVDLLRAGAPGKLFVVGDPRQSIYRFRHAEVEVFQRHLGEVRAGQGLVIELAENHRSRPELLAFTNALFGRISPAGFPPLAAAAEYQSRMPLPAVEVLITGQGELPLRQARWREADNLAARVAELVASGVQVYDRDEQRHRPIQFRDVAVLCRTRGPFADLERSLASFGVPAQTPGGREFYDRVEITDLISLLAWLADPGDSAAAAAVLRSPFFDLSDDGLFFAARGGLLAARVESGESAPELGARDRAGLERARAALAEARQMAGHSSAAQVIEFVAAATGYFEKILARRRGAAEHANLRRFVAEAERFAAHSGGLAAAADYFRRARAIAAAAADGDSAATLAPGQALSLLTIHGAKGLEFPVVAVADLGREPSGGARGAPRLDADLGLGLKLADEFGQPQETAGARLVALRQQEADAAEEDRLLYVAQTRAREKLILSGVWNPRKPARPLNRILLGMGLAESPEGPADFAGVAVDFPKPVPAGSGQRLVTLAGRLGDSFDPTRSIRAPRDLAPTAGDRQAAERVVRRLSAPELAPGGALDARVTELAEMDGCPRRHVLERLAALDAARAAPAAEAAEQPEPMASPGGAELGIAVHGILEGLDFAKPPKLAGQAGRLVATFLESAEARRLGQAQAGGRLLREAELHLAVGPAMISGSADAMVLEGGGPGSPERVLILDYKTDRDAAADLARAKRRHEFQVRLYALAARRAWPEARVEAAIAFLAAGRTVPVAADDPALATAEQRATELLVMLAGGELQAVRGELCAGCPECIRAGCGPS